MTAIFVGSLNCSFICSSTSKLGRLFNNSRRSSRSGTRLFMAAAGVKASTLGLTHPHDSIHPHKFVDEKVEWMHIDMAGPVWNDKKSCATGFGISILVEWVLKNSSS